MSGVTPPTTDGRRRRAGRQRALPPVRTLAPLLTASPTSVSTFSMASSLISGPIGCRPPRPGRRRASSRAVDQAAGEAVVDAGLHEDAVGADAGLAGVAVLGGHAPATACSRSASSKTMNGALPPSSSVSFFTVSAHWPIEDLADLGRAGEARACARRASVSIGADRGGASASSVTMLSTPARQARVVGQLGDARARRAASRPAGLTTIVQPAASAGADLARDHGDREVPGRDRGDDADRLLDGDVSAWRRRSRDRVAVDALALLGEPLDERGAVGDLRPRLGERLALLERHEAREILLVGEHQLVPAAQDPGAILRRSSAATRGRRDWRRRSRGGSRSLRAWARVPSTSPVAGLTTAKVAPESASTQAPSM